LQEAGVKHRDLTFRNMLIRLPSSDSKEYKVVFVDFGASWSTSFGSRPISNEMSSLGFHDLHSYVCSFVKYFYPVHGFCGSKLRKPIPVYGPPESFERYLTDVVRMSQQRMFEPDYPSLISNFSTVVHL
jgi:serine/threonine protein kinase